jgi:hypothetical protein
MRSVRAADVVLAKTPAPVRGLRLKRKVLWTKSAIRWYRGTRPTQTSNRQPTRTAAPPGSAYTKEALRLANFTAQIDLWHKLLGFERVESSTLQLIPWLLFLSCTALTNLPSGRDPE